MRVFAWPRSPRRMKLCLREQRVDELRDDGVVVADDAGKQRLAGLELGDQVGAELVFDGRISGQTLFNGGAQGAHRDRIFTGDHSGF